MTSTHRNGNGQALHADAVGFRGGVIRAHRAVRTLPAPSGLQIGAALGVTALVLLLLAAAYPGLVAAWEDIIAFWLTRLELAGEVFRMRWLGIDTLALTAPTRIASTLQLGVSGMLLTVALALTFAVRRLWLPLAYLLRLALGLQLLLIVYQLLQRDPLAFSLVAHTQALYVATIGLLAAIPIVLLLGYRFLGFSLAATLGTTLSMLAYFVVALPFKLVAHTAITAMLTPLVMPVLFLFCGPPLDLLVLVALYAMVACRPLAADAALHHA
jgi:hypothetical protein